jgi:hypothetical protein
MDQSLRSSTPDLGPAGGGRVPLRAFGDEPAGGATGEDAAPAAGDPDALEAGVALDPGGAALGATGDCGPATTDVDGVGAAALDAGITALDPTAGGASARLLLMASSVATTPATPTATSAARSPSRPRGAASDRANVPTVESPTDEIGSTTARGGASKARSRFAAGRTSVSAA